MGLILLRFDKMGAYGKHRIVFEAVAPYVPRKKVTLDGKRIYAIYKAKDGYYVVYETENIEFYRAYRAESVPRDAELVDRLVRSYMRCKLCGAEVEWDADEPFCPRAPNEHFDFEWVEEPVYEAKPFDWNVVERGPPETDPRKTAVTIENIDHLFKILTNIDREIRHGYILAAGHCSVFIVKPRRKEEMKIGNAEIELEEGPGFVEWSSWDEIPQVTDVGYYVAMYVRGIERGTTVVYTKLREATEEDIIALLEAGHIHIVEKFFGTEKAVELLKKKPELATKYNVRALVRLGLHDLARKRLVELLDKCTTTFCVESLAEDAKEFGLLDDEIKNKFIEVVNRLSLERVEISDLKKLLHVAEILGDGQLIERMKGRIEEMRRENVDRIRKELPREAVSSLPNWADAALVVIREFSYEVIPLKKSKFSKDTYYFSPHWKKCKYGSAFSLDIDLRKLFNEEYLIVTRTGKVFPAEVKEGAKYRTVKRKDVESAYTSISVNQSTRI